MSAKKGLKFLSIMISITTLFIFATSSICSSAVIGKVELFSTSSNGLKVRFQEVKDVSGTGDFVLDGANYDLVGDVLMTGCDLVSATSEFNTVSGQHVLLTFNATGQKKFASATAELAKETNGLLGIIVGNELISAPTVKEQINGPSAVITGIFTAQETKDLADQITAGIIYDTAYANLKIIPVTDQNKAIGGSYLPDSDVALKVGTTSVALKTDSAGKWSYSLPKRLAIGTKISIKVSLPSSVTVSKFTDVKPTAP